MKLRISGDDRGEERKAPHEQKAGKGIEAGGGGSCKLRGKGEGGGEGSEGVR